MDNVENAGVDLLAAVEAAPVTTAEALRADAVVETPVVETVAETVETPVVAPEAPAPAAPVKERKARKTKAKAEKKARGRGRPIVYGGSLKTYIATVVKKHGATNARSILNANGKSKKSAELVAQRNVEIVPKALGISMPTLLKIAKDKGVTLRRGRPAVKAAKKAA